MIRNVLILLLVIGVGYLAFQNYTLKVQNEQLSAKLLTAEAKVDKLTHREYMPTATGPKDYISLATLHVQRAEDALKARDFKLAAREYGFARLATAKAAAEGLSTQRNEVNDVSHRVMTLADQIKQLGDAIRS